MMMKLPEGPGRVFRRMILSRAIAERGRDEFTRCRLRQRYVGRYVQSTIHGNVFVSPAAGDQDIFGPLLRLFAFRIPQGVFSLLPRRRSSSHINRAFIYQPETLSSPSSACGCVRS